jgi:hypothetical protein
MHQISVGDVAAASRNARNRGFFSFFRSAKRPQFRPTYNHVPDGSACRVYGSMQVKKMTGMRSAELSSYQMLIVELISESPYHNFGSWLQ